MKVSIYTSILLAYLVLLLAGCGTPAPRYETTVTPHPETVPENEIPKTIYTETGQASFYGMEFQSRKTASGERFNQNAYSAAHRTLPFGTIVKVTNLKNGRSVNVRINDRGPFVRGRIIDLSRAAFSSIGDLRSGVLNVKLNVIDGSVSAVSTEIDRQPVPGNDTDISQNPQASTQGSNEGGSPSTSQGQLPWQPFNQPPRIPPGQMPPPGSCRIWIPGAPPGQQPPPGNCRNLRRQIPPGAWLIRG